MPRSSGPRFAVEAAFLILIAVGVGLADLRTIAIILIVGLAWLLVAVVEFASWREGPRYDLPYRYAPYAVPPRPDEARVEDPVAPVLPLERRQEPDAATEIVRPGELAGADDAPEPAVVEEPEPEPDSGEEPRARRRWFRRRPREADPEVVDSAEPPRHVRRLPAVAEREGNSKRGAAGSVEEGDAAEPGR